MSSSNETRKPAGRPSLLSTEQQNALEKHQPQAAVAAPQTAAAPRRKHVWAVAALCVFAIAAAFAVVQFGEAEQGAVTLATAPPSSASLTAAPATPVPAADPAPAAASPPPSAVADNAALPAAAAPAVAAIVDEAPPPANAKPTESLAQMLESGVPPAAKRPAPQVVRKPVKPKPASPPDRAIAAAPELDNDVELLAALVAHAKYDTSANARLPLPKALEQCKKQGKQDAARCRIRVCEGRWKKNECRAYSRSKLERVASGS